MSNGSQLQTGCEMQYFLHLYFCASCGVSVRRNSVLALSLNQSTLVAPNAIGKALSIGCKRSNRTLPDFLWWRRFGVACCNFRMEMKVG